MPSTFGELRDLLEEALLCRDHDKWCRLFDIYRSGTREPEKDEKVYRAAQRRGGTA